MDNSWRDEEADPLAPPPREEPPDDEITEEEEKDALSRRKRRMAAAVTASVVLVAAAGFTVLLVLGLRKEGGEKSLDKEELLYEIIGHPTVYHEDSAGVPNYFLYTWEAIQDEGTPQNRAYRYLLQDPLTEEWLQNITNPDGAQIEDSWARIQILERYAMATLFYETNETGNGWEYSENWLSPDHHQCEWKSPTGPVVDQCGQYKDYFGRYQALLLPNNNLHGYLPKEVFHLATDLINVDLSKNFLHGRFNDIAEYLSNEMKHLDLSQNYIKGNLNDLPHNMFVINSINLRRNLLTGTIPNENYRLDNLRHLGLSYNELSGSIPYSLLEQNLFVEELYLDHNRLNGTIPEPRTDSPLQHLWLHDNELSGSIPSFDLDSLESLFLANNRLEGPIPSHLFRIDSLNELDVSNNRLTGTISAEIGLYQSNNLQVFRAANNSLEGTIPPEINNGLDGRLQLLEALDLRGNDKLGGSIPSTLCNITTLLVDCNNFCGCHCGPCPPSPTEGAKNNSGTMLLSANSTTDEAKWPDTATNISSNTTTR